jgi:trimethylamine--corrinoid protein Co-methyltransferase
LVTDEHLELIEYNAESILEQVGIEFRNYPRAIEMWRDAGADVDGERVRFPRGLCRTLVQATAPPQYTQHARNPAHNVEIGGPNTVFAPNYGSPFVYDQDQGRRYATINDFENIVKLTYSSPHLHHSGGTVCEPVDVPVNKRHLDMVYAHLRYSDKAFMGSVTAGERAADSIELARIGFGGDLADRTVMSSLINASSPLVWDDTMLAAAETYAAANQACIISPFILSGAMAPTTAAAVAAQTLAEALAGMAFCQLVRVIYVHGNWRTNVRHTRARHRPVHRLGPRPTPRGPIPLGRLTHSIEAARRAGGLRVCVYDHPDCHGRCELRAARGRLDGRRPRRRLREIHDGC